MARGSGGAGGGGGGDRRAGLAFPAAGVVAGGGADLDSTASDVVGADVSLGPVMAGGASGVGILGGPGEAPCSATSCSPADSLVLSA